MGRKKSRFKISSTARSRFSRNVKKILFERNKKVMRMMQNMSKSDTSSINESLNSSKTYTLREQLAEWVNEYRIPKRAVNGLLPILISYGAQSLPRDYRTLLSTPTNVEIIPVAGGNLWYNGIKRVMGILYQDLDANLDIALTFNIDGLPLYKSSKLNFYPILASIFGEYFLSFCLNLYVNFLN